MIGQVRLQKIKDDKKFLKAVRQERHINPKNVLTSGVSRKQRNNIFRELRESHDHPRAKLAKLSSI